MHGSRNQQTIAKSVAVEGIGYWSGSDVRVEFRPADPDSGVVFVREDLPDKTRLPALLANRKESPLRTTLCCGEVGVDMIEHIMAALAGLRIDNCEVHVNSQEMPGCDGSASPFVDALDAAGIIPQAAARKTLVIDRVIRRGDENSWVEARPSSSGQTILQFELDFGQDNPIGQQTLELVVTPESFREELAASRTFMLEHEAKALQKQGLGRRTTYKDLLVFGKDGPLENELHWSDECVRHKLVDMVGDLALAGCDLVGRFVAYRSGHRLNAELLQAICQEASQHDSLRRCA